jgi:hypothetical protein
MDDKRERHDLDKDWDSVDSSATAYEDFLTNPVQRITTANNLFNGNP